MFAGKKSAQIREILISESAWEEMTCLFAPSLMDSLSKGSPLSTTYLALWFRVSDEGLIEIRDKTVLAYESGFASDRGVTTWTGRMRKLKELGFISTREGSTGEFHNVLIIHPLYVVKKLLEDGVITKGRTYNILAERVVEIKASWGE